MSIAYPPITDIRLSSVWASVCLRRQRDGNDGLFLHAASSFVINRHPSVCPRQAHLRAAPRLTHSSNRVGPMRGLGFLGLRPRSSSAAPKYRACGSATTVRLSPLAAKALPTNAAIDRDSGPATSRTPLAGDPIATSARAAATSSAARGCIGALGSRTVPVPGPAIGLRNSKNCVARRIVKGAPLALI